VKEERSACRIVHIDTEIKRWRDLPPSVDEVRPVRCPCCDAPSRPVGRPLVLQGHGLRERQVWGPLEPGGSPQQRTIKARRYRCLTCSAVCIVVPRGVLERRFYPASVIGWVLARIGLEQATTAEVRVEVCPLRTVGPSAVDRWLAPLRWLAARRAGRLFPSLGRPVQSSTTHALAERTAMQLVALAGGGEARASVLAFRGGALAA
jgi:hypothetical protein